MCESLYDLLSLSPLPSKSVCLDAPWAGCYTKLNYKYFPILTSDRMYLASQWFVWLAGEPN